MSKTKEPRFPDYVWFCAHCGESLSNQNGFDDHKFTWRCTNCNHKNSISKDNLRKPYAYLVDPSPKNTAKSYFLTVLRSLYGFVFRTALYCFIAAVLVVATKITTPDHLSLGLINPMMAEDYFCIALYCSGAIVLVMLVVYAIARRLTGYPDTRKHFIRETALFMRDILLYPVNLLKIIFRKTSVTDTVISIVAFIIFALTILILLYGVMNWL